MAKHRTPVAPRFIRSACYYKLIIHLLLSYSSQTATFIFIKKTSRSLSLYPGCISVYFVIWNSNTDESVVLSLCWTRERRALFLIMNGVFDPFLGLSYAYSLEAGVTSHLGMLRDAGRAADWGITCWDLCSLVASQREIPLPQANAIH